MAVPAAISIVQLHQHVSVVHYKKTSGVGVGSLSLLHGVVNFMRALPDDKQDFFPR